MTQKQKEKIAQDLGGLAKQIRTIGLFVNESGTKQIKADFEYLKSVVIIFLDHLGYELPADSFVPVEKVRGVKL